MDLSRVLIALAGVVMLISVVWHVRTWPALGWTLVLAGAVLNSDAASKPILALGGTNIFAEDVIVSVLLLAAITRPARLSGGFGRKVVLPSVIACLLGLNLIWGYSIYGIPAVVEFRPFFYFAATIIWATSLDWTSEGTAVQVRRFLYACGWGITTVAAINLARNGIASSTEMYVDADGTYRTLRPLVASQAALLAMVGIFALHDWGQRRGILRLIAGLAFVIVAVIAQHRSVWIAMAAGLTLLVLTSTPIIKRRLWAMSFAAVSLAAILVLSGFLDNVIQSLVSSIDAITANKSTLEDRAVGWERLVSDSFEQGPWAILFGQPFGTGYVRMGPTGQVQSYAPHNWFVSIYLRTGLLGLISLVLILVSACRRLIGVRSIWAGLLLCLMVFAMAYSIQWFLALVIGAAIAISNIGSGGQSLSRNSPVHNLRIPLGIEAR